MKRAGAFTTFLWLKRRFWGRTVNVAHLSEPPLERLQEARESGCTQQTSPIRLIGCFGRNKTPVLSEGFQARVGSSNIAGLLLGSQPCSSSFPSTRNEEPKPLRGCVSAPVSYSSGVAANELLIFSHEPKGKREWTRRYAAYWGERLQTFIRVKDPPCSHLIRMGRRWPDVRVCSCWCEST